MRRNVLVLAFVLFVDVLGYSIVLPLLPMIGSRFSLPPMAVGLLLAAYAAAAALGLRVLGAWSQRWGRKPILVATCLLAVEALFVTAWAGDVFMLFLARLAAGFAAGNAAVAVASARDLELSPEHERDWRGLLSAGAGLGFVTGPLLVGILFGSGYGGPAYAAGIAAAASLIAVVAFLPNRFPAEMRDDTAADPRPRGLRAVPAPPPGQRSGHVLGAMFGFVLALLLPALALPPVTAHVASTARLGFLIAYAGLIVVAVRVFAYDRLAALANKTRTLAAMATLTALALIVVAFAPSTAVLAVAVGIGAAAFGATVTLVAAIMTDGESADRLPLLPVAGHAFFGMAGVSAPLAGALLLAWGGGKVPFVAAAIVAAGAALYAAVLVPRHERGAGRSGIPTTG